jgi:hypothetical protein
VRPSLGPVNLPDGGDLVVVVAARGVLAIGDFELGAAGGMSPPSIGDILPF